MLIASPVIARADTIYLRGGENLFGKVTADERDKVVIDSQTLGRVTVARDRIDRVELDPVPVARPASPAIGQTFVPPPPAVVAVPQFAGTKPPVATAITNATANPAGSGSPRRRRTTRAPIGSNSSPANGCGANCTACRTASWSSRVMSSMISPSTDAAHRRGCLVHLGPHLESAGR